MWGRGFRAASNRAAGVLPEPRGSIIGTRAARFGGLPNGTRVRIRGVAEARDPALISPVMERPCVAYRLVVEEPGWRPVLERTGCAPFFVQDGEVTVAVRGPFRVLLRADYEWEFGNEVQRRIAALLADRPWEGGSTGQASDGGPRTRPALHGPRPRLLPATSLDEIYCQNYRYFEALVRPGHRVTVEGFASVTVDPAGERAGLREPPLLHALTGTAERPVVIAVPEPGSVAP